VSAKDLPSTFEDALTELEILVDALEHSDLSADDALKRVDCSITSTQEFKEKLRQTNMDQTSQVSTDAMIQFTIKDLDNELDPKTVDLND